MVSKYICICGIKFKNKPEADLHCLMYKDLAKIDDKYIHKIFKSHWQVRLLDWICSIDVVYVLCFVAAAFVNSLFLKYSPFNDWERLIESICVGVCLPRILRKY